MAEPQPPTDRREPDFRVTVVGALDALNRFIPAKDALNWLAAAIVMALQVVIGWTLQLSIKLIVIPLKGLAAGEDKAQGAFGELAAVAVKDLFGVDVDPKALNDRGARGRRTDAAQAIGRAVLQGLTGVSPGVTAGSLAPSADGAERFVATVTQLGLEGWLEGWLVEAATLGQLETFGELDDIMAQVLGIGRMSRRVVGPLLQARVITPFEWLVNRTYRPNLLSAGAALRMLVRGRWTREQVFEELARQGWSEPRIEALLALEEKHLGVDDLAYLQRAGIVTQDEAVRTLREQGYDEQTASKLLITRRFRQTDGIRNDVIAPAVSAYTDRLIDERELRQLLQEGLVNDEERALAFDVAAVRRALNIRRLSPAQVEACVKAQILTMVDYRRVLEREGYPPEDVTALELLLRRELEAQRALEELRAEEATARAEEKRVRDVATAARKAAVDAERALRRRGRETDLERAVVRGRIGVARYEEVLRAQYDDDTVAILVEDVEAAREAFLDDARRREEALQRAGRKQLDVGAVERAVLAGVLSLDEFRRHPAVVPLDAEDVAILVRTLGARLRDLDAARRRRAELEAKAATAEIDLGRFESLVLRGVRTLGDYAARLRAVPFDEEDVDALVELLELRLEDAAAAAAARALGEARVRPRGLSLEQLRRAVVRGVRAPADFERFLEAQDFTLDARAVLMAELARELDEVEAARLRTTQAEASRGSRALPLGLVERAARLGVITPAAYRARLEALGLDALDVDVAVALLLNDIADTQQARTARTTIERELAAKGLSYATMVRAVKGGIKSIEDARALLVGQGYDADAVATQIALLEDELAETKAALEKRARIAARLVAQGVDLDALEREVIDGVRSIDAYVADLAPLGVEPVEIGLLVGLLVEQLEAAAA